MNNKSIAEFLEHHKQFCLFRPASREEVGLFYSEPNQTLDEALGTVGHLRMDFGSGGKEFFHTWWPHNEDQFNTGDFKDDLQDVVDALRADGPLKDLSAMSTYCHQNGGAISQDGRSYGYIAETKHISTATIFASSRWFSRTSRWGGLPSPAVNRRSLRMPQHSSRPSGRSYRIWPLPASAMSS